MPALNFKVFTDKIISSEKCQTIRPVGKRKYVIGDKLYLYTGQRTKQCKKLGEAVCSEVVPITLTRGTGIQCELCYVGNKARLFLYHHEVVQLAKEDGFASLKEMFDFFITTYNLKPGDSKDFQIIIWRDFKPATKQAQPVPIKEVQQTVGQVGAVPNWGL